VSKSRSLFGGRGRSADVNVINPTVRRSSLRMAKTAFIVAGLITWALSLVILSSYMNPILAVFIAVVPALPVAGGIFLVVWVWPVLRVLVHWSVEIGAGGLLLGGMSSLYHVVPGPAVAITLLAVIGVLMGLPFLRHHTLAVAWCVISRHRLRMSFAAFIRGNREGTLPFILWAHPTPVGERVSVWLRPGLSLSELESRGDQLAVACWAKDVTVTAASRTYAPLVRFDIKRRNTLEGVIPSPLVSVPDVDATEDQADTIEPSALDLPDVTEDEVTEPSSTNGKKPAPPGKVAYTPTSKKTPAPPSTTDGDDEMSAWI
jgi:hypothetical protein